VGVSVLLHALVALVLVLQSNNLPDIAGGPAGAPGLQGGGGGGGGSAGRRLSDVTYYIDIAPLPDEAAPVEAPVIPEIEPVAVDVLDPPVIEAPAPVDLATLGGGGIGEGEGPGTGSGTGPGSGSGTGGGSGSGAGTGTGAGEGPGAGAGGTIRPPEPVAMLIPPMPPSSLRGREIPIRLQVDERGQVTAVQLLAPSGNARYDRELRRTAQEWQFRPARDPSGRAIPYVFEYTVGL